MSRIKVLIERLSHSALVMLGAIALTASAAQAQTASSDSSGEQSKFKVTEFLARLQRANRTSSSQGSYFSSRRGSSTFSPASSGPNFPVLGGGTLGRLTKWTGFNSTNSYVGDSTIFEDKSGRVGIGTDAPTSRLTVAGMIESLSGGITFPDGTVQTTSAGGSLFTVAHNSTLAGDGTANSPLRVAFPLQLIDNNVNDSFTILLSNAGGFGLLALGKGAAI